jgi:hypothetical protein
MRARTENDPCRLDELPPPPLRQTRSLGVDAETENLNTRTTDRRSGSEVVEFWGRLHRWAGWSCTTRGSASLRACTGAS